ncbi:MAG: DUF6428 family protein [Opitutae bacterium]|jgi:hypothetical protein
MKISEIKNSLTQLKQVTFVLPNGGHVPPHFHITELGIISKDYIDCGGTIRQEKIANFQLWSANDFDHRIEPKKIIDIIDLAQNSIGLEDLEVEVEYQSDTIGKYGLSFNGAHFQLIATKTDCLAKDKCGIPEEEETIPVASSCCEPSSGCC